ncbi:ovarian cancer-associated protein 2 -like [Brachionus plicatilis]|uniref:Ovarian cancer-associated protein 2-like n=1 Tax=Brachionus plicatilis TaxID=10195 RepID=A0A3M7Q501_BRAPC|nr:ovarian cancer-associated protein 2 -like [Brachionus plicatilis]
MEIVKPLRILMIHGYRQNEYIFRDKTGGLRKNLKNLAELVYCEAFHDIPKEYRLNQNEEQEIKEKCWYLKEPGCKFDYEQDFEKSIRHLDEVFCEKGPFDGIWGFSQGATMVAVLSKLLTDEKKSNLIPNVKFKFAIIAATCKSSQNELDKFYDPTRKINLHIIGKCDKLVDYNQALVLSEYFKDPKVYPHELGHFVPAKKNDIMVYSEFLKEMIDYCNCKKI